MTQMRTDKNQRVGRSLRLRRLHLRPSATSADKKNLVSVLFSLRLFGAIAFIFISGSAALRAQPLYETQTVALIDNRPIVLEAPFPFVEVSRSLPDAFAQRRANIGAANRLVAWFIPRLALKDQLDEKTDRYRSLQIQVRKDMEPVRYTPADLQKLREELVRGTPNLTPITEADIDTLFGIMDLSQFKKQTSARKILGLANLGPDSFTLCIATSAEGKDLRGGRQIEASVACVTHLLLNEKILILTVTGPEISAAELGNTMRLTREWIKLLRESNNAK